MSKNMSNQATIAPKASELVFPAASPLNIVKQRVGVTDVEISYSRPGVKGRKIFGGLVPFGKVWRTGANQATKLTFSSPSKLNGNSVPAGTYAVFSIPNQDEWTIILNKELEPMGTSKYDEKLDVLRLTVKPSTLDHAVENMRIEIEPISDTAGSLDILWEKTKVSVKVEVEFVEDLLKRVDAVMSSDQTGKPFFQAGLFYFNHGKDLKKAAAWVDEAIKERPIYPFHFAKAKILEKQGDKKAAVELAKEALESAKKMNDVGFSQQIEEFLKQNS
jgi:hypothetical protein